jgi:uncharacterized protein (TIGR02466 family)
MFADTKLVNLFPVPLWVHALNPEDAASVNESALAAIPRLRAAKPGLEPGEAWQTDNSLQDDPAFSVLSDFIHEATEGVLGYLEVDYESFLITGLWVNVTPAGGTSHRSHTHPNNFLSGVYYVKTPAGGNTIIFSDPKPQTNIIAPAFAERNAHNSRNAQIDVESGALILFPAWLPHSVNPNNGDSDRVSISFNIMFTQFGERMSKPKWEYEAGMSSGRTR